ncbi:MAG: IS200/IS605 family accessory protein TnpB-related protein, partial [Ectothiorhodospiraceae bacterium]
SRRIVNEALAHGAQAIVVEHLKGWRPRAGKRRSPLRQRFHRWFHRLLVDRIEAKATEAGLRTLSVYPRGTSSQAFDGSGKVKRDKDNASLCTFPGGKRYNADLNAAYNIAARGIVRIHRPTREGQAGAGRPKSASTPRSPVTLSSLWAA